MLLTWGMLIMLIMSNPYSQKKIAHRENVNNANNAKSKWGVLGIEPHGI